MRRACRSWNLVLRSALNAQQLDLDAIREATARKWRPRVLAQPGRTGRNAGVSRLSRARVPPPGFRVGRKLRPSQILDASWAPPWRWRARRGVCISRKRRSFLTSGSPRISRRASLCSTPRRFRLTVLPRGFWSLAAWGGQSRSKAIRIIQPVWAQPTPTLRRRSWICTIQIARSRSSIAEIPIPGRGLSKSWKAGWLACAIRAAPG